MPVGLSPVTASPIKSKSVAISISYLNLSTYDFPPKAVRGCGLFPPVLAFCNLFGWWSNRKAYAEGHTY